MRAERDAFAERLRHVEAATLQQDVSAVNDLQVHARSSQCLCSTRYNELKSRTGSTRASLLRNLRTSCVRCREAFAV